MNYMLYNDFSVGYEGNRKHTPFPEETRNWRAYIEKHFDEKVEEVITKTNKNRDDNRELIVNAINTNGANIVSAINTVGGQIKNVTDAIKSNTDTIKTDISAIKGSTSKLEYSSGNGLKVYVVNPWYN